MLKTIDRYLIRSFLTNYVLSLFVMISLYVTLHLFVNFDEFTNADPITGEPPAVTQILSNMASYYGYNLALYFAQISAAITLFAASLTLARMQRANELTALLASGTSLYRVAAPVVTMSLLMNVLWFADQEVLIPSIAPQLARSPGDVEGRKVFGVWCVRDTGNRLLSAGRFYPGDRRMARMMVLERDASGTLSGVLTADVAEWDATRKGWRLYRGTRIRRVSDAVDVFGPERSLDPEQPTFYESDLDPSEIVLRQSAQWMAFLSLRELDDLQRRDVVAPEKVAQIRHARFTQWINNMILLVLGIAFFLTREPTRVIVQGGKALAMCAAAFIITFIGQQLVGSISSVTLPVWGVLAIPSALPAWLPIILFAPVCAWLLAGIKT